MSASELTALGAKEAAALIREGRLSSEELVRACLDEIAAREPEVLAWAYIDPDHALSQARQADGLRSEGRALGPLHGVPVGIKDIIDTADMPTENGTPLHAGRRTGRDAAAVTLLREAGAIVMGKTVTTELASYHPGKTRNPHRPSHTPGGSSSGSAAAVAANMVPLTLGSQTNGSMIRPASFCGVYGFKPSFGAISRRGALTQSPPLDTIGIFARSIEDIAIAADVLTVYDEADSAMRQHGLTHHHATAMSDPPLPPVLGFVKTPVWHEAAPVTQEAFAELADALGVQCEEVALPDVFAEGIAAQGDIMLADIAKNYGLIADKGGDQVSEKLRSLVEQGRGVSAVAYNRARDLQQQLYTVLGGYFDRYGALITPASTGPAPEGLQATGNPIFCTLWTFLGTPSLSLPLLEADGLPLGVQLVGAKHDDARLLRTARWLTRNLAGVSA